MIRYVLVCLVCQLPLVIRAQEIRVGPTIGAQLSRPYYDNSDYYKGYVPEYGLSFQAGGVLQIKASEYFALHTELLYRQVSKRTRGTDDYTISRDTYNYLSAPILLRGSVPVGQWEVYINGGPSVSYWLGGHSYLRHNELIELEVYELDHRIAFRDRPTEDLFTEPLYVNNANRIQLGLEVGSGFMVPLSGRYLMVDLRYRWGHTNMGNEDSRYTTLIFYDDDLSFATHSWAVLIAYLIEFDLVKLTRKGKSKTIKGKGR